jgi:alpha-tubulin suppressor-like RCC1 family protein
MSIEFPISKKTFLLCLAIPLAFASVGCVEKTFVATTATVAPAESEEAVEATKFEEPKAKTVETQNYEPSAIVKIAAGERDAIALDTNGRVWNAGRLGLGEARYTFVNTLEGKTIVDVWSGFDQFFALDSNGAVWAAGRNENGELGLGGYDEQTSFAEVESLHSVKVASIVLGERRTIALTSEGGVWVTGANSLGQLGTGDVEGKTSFVQSTTLSDKTIVEVAAGRYHTIALGADGRVWAAGRNDRGQLGLGDAYDRTTFEEVASLRAKGTTLIAASGYHTFARDKDGKVWASGANAEGELGVGSNADRLAFTEVKNLRDVATIAVGENHTVALTGDGKVWAAGLNDVGQLGFWLNGRGAANKTTFAQAANLKAEAIVAIGAGENFTIALDNEGGVWVAGLNDAGQLGTGDRNDALTFAKSKSANDKNAIAIAVGRKHTVLLGGGGRIWTSGQNYYGQLGLGDTNERALFSSLEPSECAD